MICSPEKNDNAMHDEQLANQKSPFCDGSVIFCFCSIHVPSVTFSPSVSGYIISNTCVLEYHLFFLQGGGIPIKLDVRTLLHTKH